MGCFQSKDADHVITSPDHVITSPDHPSVQHQLESVTEDQVEQESQVPCFKRFALRELFDATNGFSGKCIVPGGEMQDLNLVYGGMIEGTGLVAIKRLSKLTWPDAQQFVDQATAVGNLRSKRLVNLLGYCVEGGERLLVAEYMPYGNRQEIPWEMRVRVAYYIAQALDYCNIENQKIYHDLSASRILFDEDGDPRLSTFGLIKNSRYGTRYSTNLTYTPPEFSETGIIIPESVIYHYGNVLVELVSGKHIPPNHAFDIIMEKNAMLLMDSSLEGRFESEDATKLLNLASKCLQKNPEDRPDTESLISAAAPLQKLEEISSHFLMVTEEQVDHEDQVDHENQVEQENQIPCFKKFTLSELFYIINEFSPSCIVSEGGVKDFNEVYIGKLEGNVLVAVKRFSKLTWPDAQHFVDQATAVGKLRSKRLVNLLGYCVERGERLLVAEYMPYGNRQEIPWEMRVRVAYYIAQALDYCNVKNQKIYHDLSASRILFDEEGDPRLSTFGLIKNRRDGINYSTNLTYAPPEFSETGTIIPESVIYSYGNVLIELVSGKRIPPNHAFDIIMEKHAMLLMDSSLEGRFENEDATKLVNLASKCLLNNPEDRPDTKSLVSAAAPLQKQEEISSYFLMLLPKSTVMQPTMLSPLRKASSRKDHSAVYEILLKTGYSDEGAESDHLVTLENQELVQTKNLGDNAFRDQDFINAIKYYSKLVRMMSSSPYATVFARRSFSYLVTGEHDPALGDAMKAQCCIPGWPTAFYLQALALWELGMESDARDMINEGAALEARRLQTTER
ncbi:hypothetical protein IGI04_012818 [Brassica rapa subsp. trilocularis]|uniref:Serine/threonine-protein kinase BSK n=1 Tax=Brassica rapa subsp. trilocularis TaxID=1813537 RepID=A0ABQ7N708_BRACM|nr:hypothetical protein IGI04_012818 [Brassica rapa subsp. trilocularis]